MAKYPGTRYYHSVLATSNSFNAQYTRPKVVTIHLIRDVNDMGHEFDIENLYMTMIMWNTQTGLELFNCQVNTPNDIVSKVNTICYLCLYNANCNDGVSFID